MTPTATLPTAMLRPPPRDRRWLVVRCAQVGVIFVLVVNFEVAVREQSASPAPADKAHAAPADHGDALGAAAWQPPPSATGPWEPFSVGASAAAQPAPRGPRLVLRPDQWWRP